MPVMPALSLIGLTTLVTTLSAPPVRAASTSRVELSWVAPAECPSQAHVTRRTNQALSSETPVDFRANVLVTRERAWIAHIALERRGVRETRRVEGESCAALADAVALIIALAASADGSRESATASTH